MLRSYEFLLFLALVPGLVILFKIYTSDRIEREPVSLILKLVFFGFFLIPLAIFLELAIDKYFVSIFSSRLLRATVDAFFCAALVEEGLKLLFLRLGTWRNKEFNYRYDAIVYAVSVSLGFAMVENVLYVYQYGISTAILRAFTSVPLHAFCGVFMGFHYGLAKQADCEQDYNESRSHMGEAFLVPFVIHGLADALLMYDSMATLLAFLIFLLGLYYVSIKRIKYCAENDVCLFPNRYTYCSDVDPSWAASFETSRSSMADNFQRPATSKRCANANSIVGFLLGIVSYLTLTVLLIPDILAIIFSLMGIKKSRNGFGIAGLVLGATSLLIGLLFLFYL